MTNTTTKNKNPLVSILVITYNSAKYVLETLESAKAQTYENIELIISDDCSTDNTIEICREWVDENKARFVKATLITSLINTGTPTNINRGLKEAKGEWLKFVSGDDALMANCIESYVNHILCHPQKLVLFSNAAQYNKNFNEDSRQVLFPTWKLKISQSDVSAKEQFEILLRVHTIHSGTLFFSKKVFEQVGTYNETLTLWEDRPMNLKITAHNIKLHYVNFISYKYRVHEGSIQIKNKNGKLLNEFQLQRYKYLYDNYIKFLPPFERFANKMRMGRALLLEKYGMNKKNFLIVALYRLTSFPWNSIVNHINKKYI